MLIILWFITVIHYGEEKNVAQKYFYLLNVDYDNWLMGFTFIVSFDTT